jgi:ABC-type transport system substrate-binding protein
VLPRRKNVLRWASATEPLTYDPHSANNFPTIAANLQVYEPLVDFNSSSEIEPALAVGWRLIGAATWEFDLRRGVRFHDGTPFTSEDVIFSLKRGTSSTSDFGGVAVCGRRGCRRPHGADHDGDPQSNSAGAAQLNFNHVEALGRAA